MALSQLRDLGVGVGLRPVHYEHFLESPPKSVSWVEVISENYMCWRTRSSGRSLQLLERVRKNLPVVLHGVSLSIGSSDRLDAEYLTALEGLIHRIEPAWISDHLCWTGIHGRNLHDLLPLPYTQEALEKVVERIKQVQDRLGRQILIENPTTYLQFTESEMSEWDFMAEMATRADCGILLDVNNVFVSAVNHGFDPHTYLNAIPMERVGQIHLAGHTDKGTHLIDTHSTPVRPEVWDLYRAAVKRFGKISAMIERDDDIPEWSELEREILQLSQVRNEELGA